MQMCCGGKVRCGLEERLSSLGWLGGAGVQGAGCPESKQELDDLGSCVSQ